MWPRWAPLALLASTIFAASASGQASSGSQGTQSAAAKAIEDVVRRFSRFDPDTILTLTTPDFTLVNPAVPTMTRDALVTTARKTSSTPRIQQDLSEFVTTVSDSIATTKYQRVSFDPSGATTNANATFLETATLKRVGGKWLLVRIESSRKPH